jgi:RNA polymerase sigma-70 factor (ECF subfamily)
LTGNETTRQFHALVWPCLAEVLRTAQILTGNTAEAEDLAQETMLKAFRAIGQFRPGTDVKRWLMTILRNARVDRLRAGAASRANVSLEALGTDPEGDESDATEAATVAWEHPSDVLDGFADREVIDALNRLPEEIRWTLLLVDVEHLDHREAGQILGVPVGTIKSRTHRGRAMLREALLPLARDRRLVREE